jgi:hypothetical protein
MYKRPELDLCCNHNKIYSSNGAVKESDLRKGKITVNAATHITLTLEDGLDHRIAAAC